MSSWRQETLSTASRTRDEEDVLRHMCRGQGFTPGSPKTSDALLVRHVHPELYPVLRSPVVAGQLLVKIQPPQLGTEPVSEPGIYLVGYTAGQSRFVNTIPALGYGQAGQGLCHRSKSHEVELRSGKFGFG